MIIHTNELVKKYRDGTLQDFERQTIDRCFEADYFERGQLSILFPYHFKAFEILFHNSDLSASDLKKIRENGQTTRIKKLLKVCVRE